MKKQIWIEIKRLMNFSNARMVQKVFSTDEQLANPVRWHIENNFISVDPLLASCCRMRGHFFGIPGSEERFHS